ncbi:MAG: methyltransferase domain-containing protein, partial [Oscillochloris sp.]|nr:methyltransferase domain-containing protein [Oscillochloris sp.]
MTLQQRLADDITDLPSAYFDLIILNSVVQYFPSIDYLLRVLTGAAQVVKPGGAIYVGDVRSLPLLKAYHAFVQCHQASPDWTSAQLALQIQQHLFDEKELVIDPAFFVALQGHLPQIQDVQIQLKRGRSYNELTSFRYQVLLRVGGDQRATTAGDGAQGYTLDWYHGKLTLSTLREMLRHERPRTLVVRDIPNARLQAAAYTLDWLDRAPAQRVAELREQLVGIDAGIEPEALWSLGAESGYAVTLCWPASGAVGCMDLYAQDAVVPLATLPRPAPPGTHAVRPWSSYANNPLRGQLQRTLVPQLREFLHRSLPEYMIPALFVLLDHLPLTPNGKLDRNALPEPLRVIRSEHAATPRTPTEQALASIWASVLGLDHVGIHDNFFALGGDSISSMQIVSRAAQRGMALSVKDLFQHQTIATLAQAATALVVDAPTDRGSARGVSLLSFYQEDAYLLSQSTTEATTFRTNHVSPYRLRGRLDLTALQQSFNVIIQRHEILRTIYLPAEQALSAALPAPVMQTVVPQAELCLARLDLRALPQAKQETAITRLRDQEELTLLDFTQAPVLRATLVQQSDDQHLLLLTTHHINVDGWSTGILLAELSAAYRAFVTGEPLSLPPLTVQYADFAAWQRRFYTPEVLAERQRYWRQLLAAPPPPLRFRLAHTRPGGEHALSAKAGSTLLRLPPLLVGQLKQVGQQCQASLAMLLLTAYAIVLARHAGVEDLLIGSPTNNRSQPGLDLLIGHFSALSFLRIDLTGAPTIAEALARVKAMLVLALSNQDITLRQLLRLTPTGWLPTGLPAAQAIFNYIVLPEQDMIDLPGLQLESVHLAKTESPRALTLFITETNLPSGDTLLKSDWMYRQDVFDAAAIA